MASALVVALMFALALTIAGARDRLLAELRDSADAIKRWGGWLLIIVGGWLIALAVFPGLFADLFPV